MNAPVRSSAPTEALVLIPGLGTDARLWEGVLPALSRACPVMVALPVGGERIEEIASGLVPLLPRRVAIAGHGLGASVALELLRKLPERVTHLALIAAQLTPETPQEAADRETRMIALRAGRLTDWAALEHPSKLIADPASRPALMSRLAAMAADLGPATLLSQSRAAQRRSDQQAILCRAGVPVSVIAGEDDPRMPEKRQAVMAGLAPQSRLARVPGAGHWPMLEAPGICADLLLEAVNRPLVLR